MRYQLRALAVERGSHAYDQADLLERLYARIGGSLETALRQQYRFVYERSEIQRRHFECSPDLPSGHWYRAVNEAALALATRALGRLFSAGESADACDGLIVCSGTSAGFPSLARKLQGQLGFPLHAKAFDLAAMGCAAGPQALFLAQRLLESGDCTRVCVVLVDLMGSVMQLRKVRGVPELSQVVAHALSSDAASAMVLSRERRPDGLLDYDGCELATRLLPDSVEFNMMSVDEDGEPYLRVGKELRDRMPAEFDQIAQPGWVDEPLLLHPGGPALLHALVKNHPQLKTTAALSFADLRENGNIGSSAVAFVLHRALAEGYPMSPHLRIASFGPGKVTAVITLRNTAVVARVPERVSG